MASAVEIDKVAANYEHLDRANAAQLDAKYPKK